MPALKKLKKFDSTHVFLVCFLLVGHLYLRGDSIASPPNTMRQYGVTATTTSANVKFSGFSSSAVLVVNDGTVDVYISFSDSVAAPTSGDEVFTIKEGESVQLDGQWNQFSHISASSTAAIRVIVTSQG